MTIVYQPNMLKTHQVILIVYLFYYWFLIRSEPSWIPGRHHSECGERNEGRSLVTSSQKFGVSFASYRKKTTQQKFCMIMNKMLTMQLPVHI